MEKRIIPSSELIVNQDGSIFHLHLKPEQLADKIILCGDPDRVGMIANYFDSRECDVQNREFRTITGSYKGKRITVQSHGIGGDNIEIVASELDALANFDLEKRCVATSSVSSQWYALVPQEGSNPRAQLVRM